jgi:hypothetical protein
MAIDHMASPRRSRASRDGRLPAVKGTALAREGEAGRGTPGVRGVVPPGQDGRLGGMVVDVDPAAVRARPPADSRPPRVAAALAGLERISVLPGSRWRSPGRERTAFATGERSAVPLATAGQAGSRRRAEGAA